MTTTKLDIALAAIAELSLPEKVALRTLLTVALQQAGLPATEDTPPKKVAPSISFGDIVSFTKKGNGRHAGTHYIRVEKFNRAGDAVVGYECDAAGVPTSPKMRWTVAATLVTVVGK